MEWRSFFGLSRHLERLERPGQNGDPLKVLDRTLDFECLRGWLVEGLVHGDGSTGGWPPPSSTARASRALKKGGSIDPGGFDAEKKVKGKKRHILVDTVGLLLHALVHPAGIQDRDGGILVLKTLYGRFPFLKKLFADGGYQGPVFAKGQKKAMPGLATEIVKRSDTAKGFEVLPRRWVVERTFAWLGRCRRLAKDFESLSRNALAFLKLASIRLMLRRLCSN